MESKKKGYSDLLVILDSATPLFTAMERRDVFVFGQALKFSIRYFRAVGITTIHSGVVDQQTEDTARHMADGVIEFTFSDPEKTQLEVRLQKILGATTERIPVTVEDHSMYFHIPPT